MSTTFRRPGGKKRGRPKKAEADRLNTKIDFAETNARADRLVEHANEMGLAYTKLVRGLFRVALDQLERGDIDEEDVRIALSWR